MTPKHLSLDSGTPEQCAMLRNEVDIANGGVDLDPLAILIAEEEEFDDEFALDVLRARYRIVGKRV
jgi:hypothetical protein